MFSQRLLVDQLAATPVGLFGIPLLSSQQMVQPSSSGNSFMSSFPMPQVTQPAPGDPLNSIAMSQNHSLSQNLSQSMSTSMISSSSNVSSLSSQSHSRTVSVSSVDSKNSSSELSSQNVPIVTPNGCIEQQTQTDGDGDGDGDGSDTITSGISQQQLGTIGSTNSSVDNSLLIKLNGNQPKRLHVSNIPFRFRDPDLRQLFGQFGPILDVEIIFNERGSKGFGFVTFANCLDADRARDQLDGTIVEGRKIEVNNATARVQAKKTSLTASGSSPSNLPNDTTAMSALRGVIQRGRTRSTLACALARHPSPLPITAPHVSLYQDPFLAYAAGTERAYQLPASYTANAAYQAAAARSYAAAAAVATQPVASYPTITGYARDYTEPYLSHGIGPITSYGSIYRGGYNRFAPY